MRTICQTVALFTGPSLLSAADVQEVMHDTRKARWLNLRAKGLHADACFHAAMLAKVAGEARHLQSERYIADTNYDQRQKASDLLAAIDTYVKAPVSSVEQTRYKLRKLGEWGKATGGDSVSHDAYDEALPGWQAAIEEQARPFRRPSRTRGRA